MRATIEDFKTGWFGITLGVKKSELDLLINRLQALKGDPTQHFHLSADFTGSGGVGDIEIFVDSEDAPNYLAVSDVAISPNRE
jgi:hypothetical protein